MRSLKEQMNEISFKQTYLNDEITFENQKQKIQKSNSNQSKSFQSQKYNQLLQSAIDHQKQISQPNLHNNFEINQINQIITKDQPNTIQGQQAITKNKTKIVSQNFNQSKTLNATSFTGLQGEPTMTNKLGMDFLFVKKDIQDELKQIDRKLKEKFELNQRRKNHQSSLKDIQAIMEQNALGQKSSLRNIDSSEEIKHSKTRDKKPAKDSETQEQRIEKLIDKISNKISKKFLQQIRTEGSNLGREAMSANCSKTLAKLRSQSTSPAMKKKKINQSDEDLGRKDNRLHLLKNNLQKSNPLLQTKSQIQQSMLKIYQQNALKQQLNQSQSRRQNFIKNNLKSKSKSPPLANSKLQISNECKLQTLKKNFYQKQNVNQSNKQLTDNEMRFLDQTIESSSNQNRINIRNHFLKQDEDKLQSKTKKSNQIQQQSICSINAQHSQQLKQQIQKFIKQKNKQLQQNQKSEKQNQINQIIKVHENLSKLDEYVRQGSRNHNQIKQESPESIINRIECPQYNLKHKPELGLKKQIVTNSGTRRKSTDRRYNNCQSSQQLAYISKSKSRDRRKTTIPFQQQVCPKTPNVPMNRNVNQKKQSFLNQNSPSNQIAKIGYQFNNQLTQNQKSRNAVMGAHNTASNLHLEKMSSCKLFKNSVQSQLTNAHKKLVAPPQIFLNVNTENNISRISFYNPQKQQSINFNNRYQDQTPKKGCQDAHLNFQDQIHFEHKSLSKDKKQKKKSREYSKKSKSADKNRFKIAQQIENMSKANLSGKTNKMIQQLNQRSQGKIGCQKQQLQISQKCIKIQKHKTKEESSKFDCRRKQKQQSPQQFNSPFDNNERSLSYKCQSKSCSKSLSKSKKSCQKSKSLTKSNQSQSHSRSKRNYYGPFFQPDFKNKIENEFKQNIGTINSQNINLINMNQQNYQPNSTNKQNWEREQVVVQNSQLKLKIDQDQLNEILRKINKESLHLKKKKGQSNEQPQRPQHHQNLNQNQDIQIQSLPQDTDSQIVLDASKKRKLIQAKNISINTMNFMNQGNDQLQKQDAKLMEIKKLKQKQIANQDQKAMPQQNQQKRQPVVREIPQLKDEKYNHGIINSSQHTELSNQPYTLVESHRSVNSQKIPIILSSKRNKLGPYASATTQELEKGEEQIKIIAQQPYQLPEVNCLEPGSRTINITNNKIQNQDSQLSSSAIKSIEVYGVDLQNINEDSNAYVQSSQNVNKSQYDQNNYSYLKSELDIDNPNAQINSNNQFEIFQEATVKQQAPDQSKHNLRNDSEPNSQMIENQKQIKNKLDQNQKLKKQNADNPYLNELIQKKNKQAKSLISINSIMSPASNPIFDKDASNTDFKDSIQSKQDLSKNQETINNENNEYSLVLQTFQKLDLEQADATSMAGPITLISHLNAPSYNSQSDMRNQLSQQDQEDTYCIKIQTQQQIKQVSDIKQDFEEQEQIERQSQFKIFDQQQSVDTLQGEQKGAGLMRYLNDQIKYEKQQKQYSTQTYGDCLQHKVLKIQEIIEDSEDSPDIQQHKFDNHGKLDSIFQVNQVNQYSPSSQEKREFEQINLENEQVLDHNSIDIALDSNVMNTDFEDKVNQDQEQLNSVNNELSIHAAQDFVPLQIDKNSEAKGIIAELQQSEELNKFLDSDIGSEFTLSPTAHKNSSKDRLTEKPFDNQSSLHKINENQLVFSPSQKTVDQEKADEGQNIFQNFSKEEQKNILSVGNWPQTNSCTVLPEQKNQIFSFSLTDNAIEEIGQQALQAQKSLPEMNINSELSTLNIDGENSSSDAGNINRQSQYPYFEKLNQNNLNVLQSSSQDGSQNLVILDQENNIETKDQINRNNDLKFINKFRKRQKEARQKQHFDKNVQNSDQLNSKQPVVDKPQNLSAEESLKVIGDQIQQKRVAIELGIEINQIEIDIQENRSDGEQQDSSSGQFDFNQFTQKVNQVINEDQQLKSLHNQKSSYGNELVDEKLFSLMDNMPDETSNSLKSDSKNEDLGFSTIDQKQVIVEKLEQNNIDAEGISDELDGQSNDEIDFLQNSLPNHTIKISEIVHKKIQEQQKLQNNLESEKTEVLQKLETQQPLSEAVITKPLNVDDHHEHLFIEKRPTDKSKESKVLVIEEQINNQGQQQDVKKQIDFQPIQIEKIQEYLKNSINQVELLHQIKQVIEMKQRQNIENDLMRTDEYVNELLQYLIQFEVLQGDEDHEALLQEFNGGVNYLLIFLNNLTQPIRKDPLEELRKLQTQDLGNYSHFETCVDPLKNPILSIDMYLDVEKQRQFAYQITQKEETSKKHNDVSKKQYNSANSAFSAISGLSASIGQESMHILNKSIFDAINESLTKFRPYGVIGEPLPWSKKYRRLQTEVDINSVDTERLFQMVKQEVYRWMSTQQGALSYQQDQIFQYIDLHIPLMPEIQDRIRVQTDDSQKQMQELTNLQKLQLQTPKELENLQGSQIGKYKGKLIEDATQDMRQTKLANLLHQEIVEDEHNWLNYEFEESQIRIDLSEIILESLVQEVVDFLNSKDNIQ